MLFYHVGNLLDTPIKSIAHQVNCLGIMGGGVAKAIKDKWPKVESEYLNLIKRCKMTENTARRNFWNLIFGECQRVVVHNDKFVYNLFGQEQCGYGKRFTSYTRLAVALNAMFFNLMMNEMDSVAIPYKMGCDRGGGDWKIVEEMLQELSEVYGIDVHIYSLVPYEENIYD